CTVSIPRGHEEGQLEAPSILHFEFREDPAKHVVLMRVETMVKSQFSLDLQAKADQVPRREALIFVHGYNVSFEDAARRTAQLTHDLGFQGIPAFYSWPSNGFSVAYTWDEQSAVWTEPHLKEFLEFLADNGKLERIHVIAHSMGNRC